MRKPHPACYNRAEHEQFELRARAAGAFLEAARNDRTRLRPCRRDGPWVFYHTVAPFLWQR